MDVLTDILGALRMRGTLYFATEFHSPWGVLVPRYGTVARFHLVVRGRCWVDVVGGAKALLEQGDLVMIPHGAEHTLTAESDTPVVEVSDVVRTTGFTGTGTLVYGVEDGGGPTRLVCGHLQFDEALAHPFLAQLPPAIVIRGEDHANHVSVDELFRFIAREAQQDRPGRDAVVGRLSEVLFIEAVRLWADREGHDRGVMAALADPRLSRSLAAIHEQPASAWTLDALARLARLGRTAFSERFRATVGLPPMRYVVFWRMQLAKRLLTESEDSVEAIASRTGYGSAAAFSRVFKKVVGRSPGAVRRSRP